MEFVWVCFVTQYGSPVVIGKGFLNHLSAVHEIKHKGVCLLRVGTVKAGERLHRLSLKPSLGCITI